MNTINQVVALGVLTLGLNTAANADQLSKWVQQAVDSNVSKTTVILDTQKSKTQLETVIKIAGLKMPGKISEQKTLEQETVEQEVTEQITSNDIREYLITLWIDPQELPGVRVQENQYESGEFQESISLEELWLDGTDNFTVENISTKFEAILATINQKYPIQFTQWDELSPNEDEVQVLNNFIALLPTEVKPVTLANALTWIMALKKYSEMDISELSAAEKVILNANVASVLAMISPELTESSLSLVLPKWLLINEIPLETDRTYSSVKIDKAVVKAISETGIELNIELVAGVQDIHAEYEWILASLKQKADSQTTVARQERIMKFHDQYQEWFDWMPTTSQIEVLEILSTWNDEWSKLKGQRLLDKWIEYIGLIDGWFTDAVIVKLRKYHTYITKYNQTGDSVLKWIVMNRLDERLVESEERLVNANKWLAESEKRLANATQKRKESERLLETLISLKQATNTLAAI